MPEAIVAAPSAPPSPPPAATPPTPPPVAPPPPSERKGSETSQKLVDILLGGVKTPQDKKPATPPPAEPPKKEDPPKGIKRTPKEPAPTPEGEKPPPVPKRGDLKKPADPPAPAPAVLPPKAEPSDDEFVKSLLEEEQALVEDARAAEKYLPDKYRGHGAKMLTFLKENAKRAAAAEKGELNGQPFEEADYQKWYTDNMPKIGALAQRELARLQARDSVREEFEPKLEAERHERWVAAESPKVKAKGNEVYGKLVNTALPDEVMNVIAERTKGIEDKGEFTKRVAEIQKEYALEFDIAEKVIEVATNDLEEFHRLTTTNPVSGRTITAFDEKNPQHMRIVNLVSDICNDFKTTGGAALKNADGKWFATREEWFGMEPEQRGPFWTFTNEQLTERAIGKAKLAVTNLVTQERKKLEERYGFKRTIANHAPQTPPATPPVAPSNSAPPAPRPTPVFPGNGSTPPPSQGAMLAGKLLSHVPGR